MRSNPPLVGNAFELRKEVEGRSVKVGGTVGSVVVDDDNDDDEVEKGYRKVLDFQLVANVDGKWLYADGGGGGMVEAGREVRIGKKEDHEG